MAQLMAALRSQFVRQTTTRGWAMSGHGRRLHCVTGNRIMLTGESNELQRSVVRRTAENYRGGRSFCTEASTEAVPPTGAQQPNRVSMAHLMAALRGQVRQTATRGWAVFAPSSHQSATSRSMFTSHSKFLQCSQPVVRRTAGNCLQGHLRQFCNKPPTANSTQVQKLIWWRTFSLPSPSCLFNLFGYGGIIGCIALVLTAVGMYFEIQRNKLAHVNDQLSKLYGPLYGNRQATRRIYTKVLSDFYKEGKDYGTLEEYLEVTREKWLDSDEEIKERGRKMLTRWRRFLLTVIHPLDKEAEKIIRANAHLIEDSENNAEIFCKFIFHVNYEKFIVAKWVDRDFVVAFQEMYRDKDFDSWNNTGTLDKDTADSNPMLLELEKHVDETYKILVIRQKKLTENWYNR